MADFAALPGFYQLLFLHIEPISTILTAVLIWFFPGAAWFHGELIPSIESISPMDERSVMAVWQLGNCYFLLGLISTFVFRAVRDALPNNPVAQERIIGASFLALAIADVTHMLWTFIGLPESLRYDPLRWNSMVHGNITFVIVLLSGRLAWFAGIGRTKYGNKAQAVKAKSS
ncbi:hypothetical protein CERSUDRAFT_128116 [Gelatoporia subvermispora B]|uniref:DUF7704 domain-containing protein n=1 Tax=Ceriporiopsis subvermispora (strain B) TaxID=914234 RepID=M2RR71_CERS8|nr:hypothetical protein CERSUDRAFT_128116 [Gelatoporia subvermispora B]